MYKYEIWVNLINPSNGNVGTIERVFHNGMPEEFCLFYGDVGTYPADTPEECMAFARELGYEAVEYRVPLAA